MLEGELLDLFLLFSPRYQRVRFDHPLRRHLQSTEDVNGLYNNHHQASAAFNAI